MRARFGDFVVDTGARELRRSGRPVALSASGIALLALLIARRPRVVTQAELRDALWPDSSVGYTSLARVVSELRKALGESADSTTYVRTVPRFGYAFTGPASVDAEEAVASPFLLVAEDRDSVLPAGELLVGRGTECAVRLASPGVSRVHARLQVDARGARLADEGSKNGTWVNGSRIAGTVPLEEGDEVVVGTYRMVFRSSAALDSTRTATPR
jgi:DNA-binding winged helix-turn-helix (wHTH) protein